MARISMLDALTQGTIQGVMNIELFRYRRAMELLHATVRMKVGMNLLGSVDFNDIIFN